jgi:LexA DNA binding domain
MTEAEWLTCNDPKTMLRFLPVSLWPLTILRNRVSSSHSSTYYTKINRIPPAEIDMRRYFQISPPAVHEMIKTLHKRGFISREPGKPRTIRVLLPRDELPDLE